jgi:hypothetical protein
VPIFVRHAEVQLRLDAPAATWEPSDGQLPENDEWT